MSIAQQATSLILSIRKKERHRVRQPLAKVMVPVLNEKFERQLKAVEELILSEVNVKELDYLKETSGVIEKSIKANFKSLGPKYGKQMKEVASAISQLDQGKISEIETEGILQIDLSSGPISISLEDVEIVSKDIPGWSVANEGSMTVALDLTLTEDLKNEGLARELVNRIQNIRKDKGLLVTDRIALTIEDGKEINKAVTDNLRYICAETLADDLKLVESVEQSEAVTVELVDDLKTQINISTFN